MRRCWSDQSSRGLTIHVLHVVYIIRIPGLGCSAPALLPPSSTPRPPWPIPYPPTPHPPASPRGVSTPTFNDTLEWLSLLPILMQNHSGGDCDGVVLCIVSLFPHLMRISYDDISKTSHINTTRRPESPTVTLTASEYKV